MIDWPTFFSTFIAILIIAFALFSVVFLWTWAAEEFGPGWGLIAFLLSGAFWVALGTAIIK